jgi:hypothetical protein
MSKRRLEFQRYLIHEYVQKPNKLRNEFDPKTGAVKILPSPLLQNTSSGSASTKEEEKKNGYNCGDTNLTERFNPNNKELNTRRFNEANAHVLKNK